jgi:hypothetical protein
MDLNCRIRDILFHDNYYLLTPFILFLPSHPPVFPSAPSLLCFILLVVEEEIRKLSDSEVATEDNQLFMILQK